MISAGAAAWTGVVNVFTTVWCWMSVDRAIALLTAVLVGVTWWYAWLTRWMVRAQVEPQVDVAFAYEQEPGFTITNSGTENVADVHIVVESLVLAGDVVVSRGKSGRSHPGSPWFIKAVAPGKTVTRSIAEAARSALLISEDHARINAEGHLSLHFARDQDFDPAVRVRVDYRRRVDRRRYSKSIVAEVGRHEPGGDPWLISTELERVDLPRLHRRALQRPWPPPESPPAE